MTIRHPVCEGNRHHWTHPALSAGCQPRTIAAHHWSMNAGGPRRSEPHDSNEPTRQQPASTSCATHRTRSTDRRCRDWRRYGRIEIAHDRQCNRIAETKHLVDAQRRGAEWVIQRCDRAGNARGAQKVVRHQESPLAAPLRRAGVGHPNAQVIDAVLIHVGRDRPVEYARCAKGQRRVDRIRAHDRRGGDQHRQEAKEANPEPLHAPHPRIGNKKPSGACPGGEVCDNRSARLLNQVLRRSGEVELPATFPL